MQRHLFLACAATLLACASAQAQMRVVTQSRSVYVRALAGQANPPMLDQLVSAPDTGPFNASPNVQRSSSEANASASGSQLSTIATDQITCDSSTAASANITAVPWDPFVASSAYASSWLEVTFDLDYPVRFEATGNLFAPYASSYVTLDRPSAPTVWSQSPGPQANTPIDGSGVLTPGRYKLIASASASASGASDPFGQSGLDLEFVVESLVGDNYCATNPNSSGTTAVIGASGSSTVSDADLVLHVGGAKPNAAGLFFYGPTQAPLPFGSGVMCVGAPRYRLSAPAQTNTFGALDHVIDFNAPPAGSGPSAFAPGVTWNFQFWYRDAAANPTFNTSNGLSIAFQ